ncbi:hypothetical protein D9615_008534 [Tricholomella constricta]|uniref:Uncharacterized protein n=1 Tax=Tricholomella constricta TaxID=117010 RepID=A0A8H5H3Z9_9AGAR|nr:hypothetical protein D9615_008534 [Tricholomella constricta]
MKANKRRKVSSDRTATSQTQRETDGSEISRLCTAVTDRYRAGEFSKPSAILLIHDILCKDGADPEADAFVAAFSSFVAILDGFERFRANAAVHGARVPDGAGEDDQPGDGGPRNTHDPDPTDDGHSDPAPPAKRPRSSSDDDGQVSSRRRIDVSTLPWIAQEEETPSVLSPDLRRTQLALENFARDLKVAKSLLTNSPRCPQFPGTEWSSLLSGKAVDFDRVLSSLYSVSFDDQRRERLGHLEIVAGPTAPARTVRTHSEWVIACDSAWEAMIYVFPHRAAELAAYGKYVKQLFASFAPTRHSRVIQFDRAVRLRVAQRRDLLLTDHAAFADLSMLWLQNAGASGDNAGMTGNAPTEIVPVPTPTFAPGAETLDMLRATAPQPLNLLEGRTGSSSSSVELLLHYRPSYARDLIWAEDADKEERDATRCTLAFASTIMPPLSPVPDNELSNLTACTTIYNYPHLFRVSSPINVSVFRDLLRTHPNQPLVDSVCNGFSFGFWPRAITAGVVLPTTFGDVYPLRNPGHVATAIAQRDKEIELGAFFPTFSRLLPGMLAVPVTISERNPTKPRLCVDHSAEPLSRNSMIPKASFPTPLDNLQDLGRVLRKARASLPPGTRLVLFKSDVARAYRTMPMHPLWQIKQVVKIDGLYTVDWNNNFGNRAAGDIWGAFFALVIWIAIYIKLLADLLAYVDDSFSWELENNLLYYAPYNRFMPAKQVHLLTLWDELRVPHNDDKQVWGAKLTIIGMEVDTNAMTITMPNDSRADLLTAIRTFAVPGTRHPLREFQKLGGWINWALNVYPLLRPGLCHLYMKMSGKQNPFAKIWVSRELVRELIWLADHITTSSGIFILDSVDWPITTADETLYTDASGTGMGYWSPSRNMGFHSAINERDQRDKTKGIFFFEAMAVTSALLWAAQLQPAPRRIAIFTDSQNTVDIFDSFRASPRYNPFLITSVDLLIRFRVQLSVRHIPGEENGVANALSRHKFDVARELSPGLTLLPFTPPRLTLGAAQI